MNTETILQNKIRVRMSELGCIVLRQHSGLYYTQDGTPIKIGVTGVSDLLVLAPNGKAVFMELKTQTGRPSKEQKNFIARVREMGFEADIVRSVEAAEELVRGAR